MKKLLLLSVLACFTLPAMAGNKVVLPNGQPVTALPYSKPLNATNLAILVNTNDPVSVEIGELYRKRHGVPETQVIKVAFPAGVSGVTPAQFAPVYASVKAATPAHVQSYLVTWYAPYKVNKMSMTSAFAFGYDPKYEVKAICNSTADSPYYDSAVSKPYSELGIRPTMMLGAKTVAEANALIDRGLVPAYDPVGTAYFASTTDANRNVRKSYYNQAAGNSLTFINTSVEYTNALVGKTDVMTYFTGLAAVSSIETNKFLPGAVADHLTSYGGDLNYAAQMKSTVWLQKGATGSYGTVVEPCNFVYKFPNPAVFMRHYLAGETLGEAYWKSVKWPGEGLFLGNPLARPFSGAKLVVNSTKQLVVSYPYLPYGNYVIEGSYDPSMPAVAVKSLTITAPNGGMASAVLSDNVTLAGTQADGTKRIYTNYNIRRLTTPVVTSGSGGTSGTGTSTSTSTSSGSGASTSTTTTTPSSGDVTSRTRTTTAPKTTTTPNRGDITSRTRTTTPNSGDVTSRTRTTTTPKTGP